MLYLSESFMKGYGRVSSLFGLSKKWPDYNNGPERDLDALKGDWERVGKTIWQATCDYQVSDCRSREKGF